MGESPYGFTTLPEGRKCSKETKRHDPRNGELAGIDFPIEQLVFAEDADDATLNFDVVGSDDYGRHL